MIGGLIAGALEGGAKAMGGIATNTLKVQQDEARMRLEQELSIERDKAITRNRLDAQRADELSKLDPEGDYFKADSNARKTRAKDEADVRVDADKRSTQQRIELENENLRLYGTDQKIRAGVRAKAADSQGPLRAGDASVAALNALKLEDERKIRTLRGQLVEAVKTGNADAQETIQNQIDILSGAKPTSMADVASLVRQKNDLASKSLDPDEAKRLREEANALEARFLQKRGVRPAGAAADKADPNVITTKSGRQARYNAKGELEYIN